MPNCCTVCMNNGRKNKDTSFFVYPKDLVRRRNWLIAVGREDLIERSGDYRICEQHFERKFIVYSKYRTKKYISDDAFPSLNIPSNVGTGTSAAQPLSQSSTYNNPLLQIDITKNEDFSIKTAEEHKGALRNAFDQRSPVSTQREEPLIIISDETTRFVQTAVFDPREKNIGYESKSTQTPLHLSEDTPRKRKLYLQLKEAKKAKTTDLNRVNKEGFLKLSDKFMSKSMTQLIKWQIDLKAGSSGNRYSVAFKFFALNLHYSGPVAYRFLRNILCLPPLPILKKLVMPIGTKTDDRLLNALRIKVSKMSPQEKICSVCVNCMSVKSNLHYDSSNDKIVGFHEINGRQTPEAAKYVIVMMVRGIIHKWKQPVAHSFLAKCKYYPEVNAWIDEIISALLDIGLDIRVFVTDQSSDFVSAAKARSINANKTYFDVKGHKIYYVFDVPHLTKSIRNNLQTCNFVFDNKVAKFSDIIDMYSHDQKKALRLAPKLTQLHLNPKNFQKMHVKLAVQVLSNTVAAAIKTYVDLNEMHATALDTANLIKKINRLFDILNSSTIRSPDKFKRGFWGDDYQIAFLQEMLIFFKQLKLVKIDTGIEVTKTMNFINGFQVTINSVLQLFEDLKSQGFQFTFTRRLNQDELEHFFGKLRQAGGNWQEPTCRQVSNTFKKNFVSNILQMPKVTNCDDDYDSLLMKVSSEMTNTPNNLTPLDVETNDYKFDLPKTNTLVYVAGYLYRKCLNRHQCDTINLFVKRSEKAVNMRGDSIFSHYKDFNERNVQSGFIIVPSDNFVRFIELMEKKFRSFFDIHHTITNVGQEILKYLDDCTFEMPCPCFPLDYLKKLYIRFRIYHTIKRNNKLLKTQPNRKKNILTVCNL